VVPIKCPQRMKTSKIKHGRSRGGWRGWRGWRGFLCCAQMAVFLTRIDLRSTCNECPKNVQRMSKECPKNVKRMSKECPKNVQRMSKECPKNVQRMSKECPKNVQRMSKECPKNVKRMSKECPKNVQRMSKECPKKVQRMSKEANRTKNAKQTPPRHHLLRSILPKISATHAWLSLSTRCRSRPPSN
jgi:histone H3/H4